MSSAPKREAFFHLLFDLVAHEATDVIVFFDRAHIPAVVHELVHGIILALGIIETGKAEG